MRQHMHALTASALVRTQCEFTKTMNHLYIPLPGAHYGHNQQVGVLGTLHDQSITPNDSNMESKKDYRDDESYFISVLVSFLSIPAQEQETHQNTNCLNASKHARILPLLSNGLIPSLRRRAGRGTSGMCIATTVGVGGY